MSNKPKPSFVAPAPKPVKPKRPSTVSVATTSSRAKVPSSAVKDKTAAPRPRFNKNTTIIGDGAVGDISILKQEGSSLNFDAEKREIAFGHFLDAMLKECLFEEKIEREETQMDIQMAQLADRFQQTMDMLDKTNRRLKDVSFVVEQKRLLDLKSQDCSQFYEITDSTNAQELLHDLNKTEQVYLNRLQTENVDFGYSKESGHQQLLDAVNEAIDGLDKIKKHSTLDVDTFHEIAKEYGKSQSTLEELQKDRLDFDGLKTEFDEKYPKLSERLLKEASEKISKMFNGDDD